MHWIFNVMWSIYLLRWILLSSVCPVAVESAVTDPACFDNCNCCKNNICHTGIYDWPNVCSEGCIDRHRAARCYELCTYNCVSCEYRVDICSECFDGFYLGSNKDCTSKCPTNCKACTSNTMCTACKEGYYNKDGSTTCPYTLCPGSCECSGNTCTTCKNGFFDTGSDCREECPSNCMTCLSRDICNKCKHGFYNGYEFDSNVRQLLNNCTFECRESCLECQSYDNCLQCINGYYDQMCKSECSVGCKDRTCHIESGNCDCSSNFVGAKCNECVEGKYGAYCDQICAQYCKNGICNKKYGQFSECITHYYGPFCNKKCDENCNASQNTDESYCDQSDGICLFGCKDGYFGLTCNRTCSCNCIDGVCKQENGACVNGCTGSYEDLACTITLGKPKVASDDNYASTTIVVLATLLALITTALCSLILGIVVRKMRSAERQTGKSMRQIPYDVNQTLQNQEITEADNAAYEIPERTPGTDEHTYESASPSAPTSEHLRTFPKRLRKSSEVRNYE